MVLLAGMSAIGGVLTLAVLARGANTLGGPRALGGAAVMLVAGALGALFLLLWQRNFRLLVGPGMFGFQDVFGRRHTWIAAEVGNVLDVTIRYRKSFTQEAVFVLGQDGRRIMAINPGAWRSTSVDRLVWATGRELQTRPGPISAADFRREFPRAMSWASTHPNLIGGGLVVVAMTLAIGIPIATIWLHR